MNKNISNEEFELALNDINNKLIMEKACGKFRKSIENDELYRCKLIALWEAMQTWNPAKRKFTSFLYQKVTWECLKVIKIKKRNQTFFQYKFDPKSQNVDNLQEHLEILPTDLKDIFTKRYLYNMTLKEISEKHGFCIETIRRRLLAGVEIIKNNEF